MSAGLDALSVRQRELLEQWLPSFELVRDHSWGLIGTTVLEIRSGDDRLIVKAGDASDHHMARELRAHRLWLDAWTAKGWCPRLLRADDDAKLLLREHLAGVLVEGSGSERDPSAYVQAGAALAVLHHQLSVRAPDFESKENEKTLAWLDRPHRIAPDVVGRLRDEMATWPTPPAIAVPTHGDWQPRNWLVHDGELRVIDFGRADLRPAITDFARLAAQQFRAEPALEAAFLQGYGGDPREPAAWRRVRVREAVGTAAWAYQVGNEAFERQGHRMIAEALAEAPTRADDSPHGLVEPIDDAR